MNLRTVVIMGLLAVLIAGVAGCTSPTSSSQAASSASSAATTTTAKAAVSASASASARPSVTPSPTPSSTPSPTPSTQPVTGSFGQSAYTVDRGGTVHVTATGLVTVTGTNTVTVTATVSNRASNPEVEVILPNAHGGADLLMQPTGNGGYSIVFHPNAALETYPCILTLRDNGVPIDQATLTTIVAPSPTPTSSPTVIC